MNVISKAETQQNAQTDSVCCVYIAMDAGETLYNT